MLPGPPAGQKGSLGVPGGSLKPNDLGLFDMLGNALEVVSGPTVLPYKPGEDVEDGNRDIKDINSRVLRGGRSSILRWLVRSADRYWFRPSVHERFGRVPPGEDFPLNGLTALQQARRRRAAQKAVAAFARTRVGRGDNLGGRLTIRPARVLANAATRRGEVGRVQP